jgi:hypothetical protein
VSTCLGKHTAAAHVKSQIPVVTQAALSKQATAAR